MCGIVGYISADEKSLFHQHESIKSNLTKMMAEMSYRGPDGQGFLEIKGKTGYVGHLRLSIICLDDRAAQPYNVIERYILTFNGEIYNFSELAKKYLLDQEGVDPDSDTSVLYFLIIKFGISKALSLVNGQFAFFFFDQVNNVAYLARDLYGEKPIYYFANHKSFAFCSEPNGLSKFFSADNSANYNSIQQYLSTGFVWGNNSGFSEIKKVPPDSYISIKVSSNDLQYSIKENLTAPLIIPENNFEPSVAGLENLLFKAVEDCLRGDVNFGLLLSGGLDSTLISLIASKISSKKLTSYTLSTNDPNSDEVSYARKIASYLQIENKVTEINDFEVEKLFSSYSNWVPDLNADPSMIALHSVCKSASADVKVLLSGDGGDELQYGYNRHIYWYYLHESPIAKVVPNKVKEQAINLFLWGLSSNLPGFKRYLNRESLINKIKFAKTSLSDMDKFYFTALSSGNLEQLQNFVDVRKAQIETAELFESQEITRDIIKCDKRYYLGDNVLLKSDRASMYASVELRSPFLDKRFVNWSNNLNPKSHIFGLHSKNMSRKLLKRHLPKFLIDRPKQGFGSPIEIWMRGVLQSQITKLFKCTATSQKLGFDERMIFSLWNEFLNQKNNNSDLLWRLAILFQWHQRNF